MDEPEEPEKSNPDPEKKADDKEGKGTDSGEAKGEEKSSAGEGDKPAGSGEGGTKEGESEEEKQKKLSKHKARGGGRRGKGGTPRRFSRGQPQAGGPVRVRLPRQRGGEIFGIAETLLGGSRITVMCEDGKSRMGRIPGKMKKREWIREGDLVIVKPWAFQDEKADVVWRYTKNQAMNLARKRLIPETIDIYS